MTSNFFDEDNTDNILDLSVNPLDLEKMSKQDKLTKLKQRLFHAQRAGYGHMTCQLELMIADLEEVVRKETEEKLLGDEKREKKSRRTRSDNLPSGRRSRRTPRGQGTEGNNSSQ